MDSVALNSLYAAFNAKLISQVEDRSSPLALAISSRFGTDRSAELEAQALALDAALAELVRSGSSQLARALEERVLRSELNR